MSDPQRITEARPDALESDLIVSMRDDAPSRRARDRTLAALGLGGATLGVSTSTTAAIAGKAAMAGTWIAVGKWIALGIGGGALVVGLLHEKPEPRGRFAVAAAPPTAIVAPVEGPMTPVIAAAPPSAAQPLVPSPKAPVARPIRGLTEEIALLDLARRATRAGEPLRTLDLLGSYRTRFPRGLLAPEASVLRIEALMASGQKSAAISLARDLLAISPTGPHAERLRTIVSNDFAP